jgi:hypothetical protein
MSDVGAHRDATRVLDTRADHHVVHARREQPGRKAASLLAGPGLAIHGRRRRRHRQPGLQPRVARDVVGLLADLRHGAGDDVLDKLGLDSGAIDHRAIGRAEQLDRMHVPKPALGAVAAADRRARRLHDHLLASRQRIPLLVDMVWSPVSCLTEPTRVGSVSSVTRLTHFGSSILC